MVADLCMRLEVVGVPTVREDDGLALLLAQPYLDADQRRAAARPVAALRAGAEAAARHRRRAASRRRPGRPARCATVSTVDYLELTVARPGAGAGAGEARLLVAARVGTTRLIDNIAVTLGGPGAHATGAC